MTTTRETSLARDCFLLFVLIAPIAAAAAYFWGDRLNSELRTLRESHRGAHHGVEELLPLESPTASALAASGILDKFPRQDFVVTTADGELVAHSKNAALMAQRTVTESRLRDVPVAREFSLTRDPDTIPLAPTAFSVLLDEADTLVMRTRIPGTHLELYSFADLRPVRAGALDSLAFIFKAALSALLLGFAVTAWNRSRHFSSRAQASRPSTPLQPQVVPAVALSSRPRIYDTPSPVSASPRFPKRTPVLKPKARVVPPPPPVLRAKNLRLKNEAAAARAGKGYIRIVDALGKSDWVEIGASRPSSQAQNSTKPSKTQNISDS